MNFEYLSLLLYFLLCNSVVFSSFAPRASHVTLISNDELLLFGGYHPESGTFYNDLLKYDFESGNWSPIKCNGDEPNPRRGASATPIRKDFWLLFGGDNGQNVFNDVLLMSTKEKTWLRGIPTTTTRILPRSGHAATSDGAGNVYIFGGLSQEGRLLGDLWKILLTPTTILNKGEEFSMEFHEMHPVDSSNNFESPYQRGPVPSKRSGHSITFLNQKLYLFGGYTDKGIAAECEVYILDLPDAPREPLEPSKGAAPALRDVTWTFLKQQPPCPKPREGHSAVRHGNTIYVIARNTWTDVTQSFLSQTTMSKFSPRMDHRSTISGNKLIISGGARLGINSFDDTNTALLDTGCPDGCFARGSCQRGACACNEGFYSNDCGEIEFTAPPISAEECNYHGKMSLGGKCECYLGFSGGSCEFGKNKCINDCSGHGICNLLSQCECQPGFMDIDCSFQARCPDLCCHHGNCRADGRCECTNGFFGPSCSISAQQVAEMSKQVTAVQDHVKSVMNKLNAAMEQSREREKGFNTKLQAGNLSLLDAEKLHTQIKQEQMMQQQLTIAKGTLQAKMEDVTIATSYQDIANKYFTSSQCIATAVSPTFQGVNIAALTPGQAKETKAGISPFSSTGRTAKEQLKKRIQRLEKTEEKGHAMPPGPNNEALEDVLDIAEKEMEDASKQRKEMEEKQKKEREEKELQAEVAQPLITRMIPTAAQGVPTVPSGTAGEDLRGAIAHAPLSTKLLVLTGLILAGILSVLSIYWLNNKRLLSRSGGAENPDELTNLISTL